jgi:hypothetical protein
MDAGSLERITCKKRNGKGKKGKEKEEEVKAVKSLLLIFNKIILILKGDLIFA